MIEKFKIQKKYLLFALLLFVVEVLIAVYAHDRFVRPFVGDCLVVILLYCLVKAFWDTPVGRVAGAVLLFAFVVEGLQYLHVVKLLGLQQYKLANIIIGTTFQWTDLLAYSLGIALVVWAEK